MMVICDGKSFMRMKGASPDSSCLVRTAVQVRKYLGTLLVSPPPITTVPKQRKMCTYMIAFALTFIFPSFHEHGCTSSSSSSSLPRGSREIDRAGVPHGAMKINLNYLTVTRHLHLRPYLRLNNLKFP